MLVNMMVKNHITSTKPLITGDIDEVRVQSEEPNSKKPAFEQAFYFLIINALKTSVLNQN